MEYHCCLNTNQSWLKKWRLFVCATSLLCYLFICMMNNGTKNLPSLSEIRPDFVMQRSENLLQQDLQQKKTWTMAKELSGTTKRLLLGGSSPPQCNSKCGQCTPCKPVLVQVPPRVPMTIPYYPQAWRCKCGNKLYMP